MTAVPLTDDYEDHNATKEQPNKYSKIDSNGKTTDNDHSEV